MNTISDQIISLIRTVVPYIIGLLIAGLAERGLDLDLDTQGLTLLFQAIVTAGYYALVRWAESKISWLGWFLGFAREPRYPVPIQD